MFQEKLLNKIQENFDWGKISKLEYTKIMINDLEELQRQGIIKILRKPGDIADIDKEVIKDATFTETNEEIKLEVDEDEQEEETMPKMQEDRLNPEDE